MIEIKLTISLDGTTQEILSRISGLVKDLVIDTGKKTPLQTTAGSIEKAAQVETLPVLTPASPAVWTEDALRKLCVEVKHRTNNTEGIKKIIVSFGANSISELDPKCYADAAKAIGAL
jgi:hypothetical protein